MVDGGAESTGLTPAHPPIPPSPRCGTSSPLGGGAGMDVDAH